MGQNVRTQDRHIKQICLYISGKTGKCFCFAFYFSNYSFFFLWKRSQRIHQLTKFQKKLKGKQQLPPKNKPKSSFCFPLRLSGPGLPSPWRAQILWPTALGWSILSASALPNSFSIWEWVQYTWAVVVGRWGVLGTRGAHETGYETLTI